MLQLQLVSLLLLYSIVFFQFPSKVQVFTSLFSFFQFYSVVCQDGQVQNSTGSLFFMFFHFFFFLFTISRSGRLAEIRRSVCILKSRRILCVLFPKTDSGLCMYPLFVWSNLNFLHNSQWITFPAPSCLLSFSLFTPWEFFTSALGDGLLLEFKWQQVSTSL